MTEGYQRYVLAGILLIAALLRLFNYWDFSLSNDELSALARLNFNSFNELIQKGVRIDGHPPAAQVILWLTTRLFGDGVAAVRLPFVLAGILSVYYMYKLGAEWNSRSTGLLAAALFGTLAFPILYGRIARPYALGLLFSLMASTHWIRIVKENYTWKDVLFLSTSLALCAYSHFFAALVAAMLAFAGTFAITGKTLKTYMAALFGAFLLYLPYVPTFLHQLSLGGVGQWLGPPENDWLLNHVHYTFNDSWWLLFLCLFTGLAGWVLFRPRFTLSATVVPMLFFLIPFGVGFGYSKWVNPVLQNSTLLFSFPFLIISIFSGWKDERPNTTYLTVIFLIGTGIYSTVIANRFYTTEHFGVFKEVAEEMTRWNNEVNENALVVGDFNHPTYIHYYLDRIGTVTPTIYRTTDEHGLANLKTAMITSPKEYLIYGWSTVNQIPEVEELIRQEFPLEVHRQSHFNSGTVMFKRGMAKRPDVEFTYEATDNWNYDAQQTRTDTAGGRFVLLDSANAYGPTFVIPLRELNDRGMTQLALKVTIEAEDIGSPLVLVYEQANDKERYSWESDGFDRQLVDIRSAQWCIFKYQLKPETSENDVLKVYVWLPNGRPVKLRSMELRFL